VAPSVAPAPRLPDRCSWPAGQGARPWRRGVHGRRLCGLLRNPCRWVWACRAWCGSAETQARCKPWRASWRRGLALSPPPPWLQPLHGGVAAAPGIAAGSRGPGRWPPPDRCCRDPLLARGAPGGRALPFRLPEPDRPLGLCALRVYPCAEGCARSCGTGRPPCAAHGPMGRNCAEWGGFPGVPWARVGCNHPQEVPGTATSC
jgi:hypothetical protein